MSLTADECVDMSPKQREHVKIFVSRQVPNLELGCESALTKFAPPVSRSPLEGFHCAVTAVRGRMHTPVSPRVYALNIYSAHVNNLAYRLRTGRFELFSTEYRTRERGPKRRRP